MELVGIYYWANRFNVDKIVFAKCEVIKEWNLVNLKQYKLLYGTIGIYIGDIWTSHAFKRHKTLNCMVE